jgi:hypothetical protein
MLASHVSGHFGNTANTDQSRIQCSHRVVMLTEPRGRREMNTTNWNLERLCKFYPRRSYFRVGIGVVFKNVNHAVAVEHSHTGFR